MRVRFILANKHNLRLAPFQGVARPMSMRLLWDWRLARVLDDSGSVVDESVWSRGRNPSSVAERLDLIGRGRMTEEARTLAQRFPEAERTPTSSLAEGEWPPFDDEEHELLGEASIVLAQKGVGAAAADPDKRLEHLVRASDELRSNWTTLEARVVEWAGLFLPTLDLDSERSRIPAAIAKSASPDDAASKLGANLAEAGISEGEWKALHSWALGVTEVESRLASLENATRVLATEHLPSTSALIGPLLAARMCTEAHGLARLARLPSGTVQVLGAESSFFLHLRDGIPVPKHGHIFQHPWISRSPRWVRGKIARTLAGKVSICARLDAYGGTPLTAEQVAEVEAKVDEIRKRHPQPAGR